MTKDVLIQKVLKKYKRCQFTVVVGMSGLVLMIIGIIFIALGVSSTPLDEFTIGERIISNLISWLCY
jgi:hypothetical protein